MKKIFIFTALIICISCTCNNNSQIAETAPACEQSLDSTIVDKPAKTELELKLEEIEVETPIEKAMCPVIAGRKQAIVPILRAGLGMVGGDDSHRPAGADIFICLILLHSDQPSFFI